MKRFFRRFATVGLLACIAGAVGGCHVFGAWTRAMFPETIPPKYELPEDKKILVFVDDKLNPIAYPDLKRRLTESTNELLLEQDLAAKVIEYPKILDFETSHEDFYRISVAEVGDALGADLVLYVHIDQFQLRERGQDPLWHGRLGTTVRVVDVHRGMIREEPRLWPIPDGTQGYTVETVDRPVETETSRTYGKVLADEMADEMAERIVNLFREHKVYAEDKGWNESRSNSDF
jgi:hypothetical protein